MASNNLNIDVRIGVTVPDEVAERCLAVVRMWLEDHPDMTVRIERDDESVKSVGFCSIGQMGTVDEKAKCQYLHPGGGDNEYRCWGQKDTPVCYCGGDTTKCETLPRQGGQP